MSGTVQADSAFLNWVYNNTDFPTKKATIIWMQTADKVKLGRMYLEYKQNPTASRYGATKKTPLNCSVCKTFLGFRASGDITPNENIFCELHVEFKKSSKHPIVSLKPVPEPTAVVSVDLPVVSASTEPALTNPFAEPDTDHNAPTKPTAHVHTGNCRCVKGEWLDKLKQLSVALATDAPTQPVYVKNEWLERINQSKDDINDKITQMHLKLVQETKEPDVPTPLNPVCVKCNSRMSGGEVLECIQAKMKFECDVCRHKDDVHYNIPKHNMNELIPSLCSVCKRVCTKEDMERYRGICTFCYEQQQRDLEAAANRPYTAPTIRFNSSTE